VVTSFLILSFCSTLIYAAPLCRCEAPGMDPAAHFVPALLEMPNTAAASCTVAICKDAIQKAFPWANLTAIRADAFPAPIFTFDSNNVPNVQSFDLAPQPDNCNPTFCCCANNSGYPFLGSASFGMHYNATTKEIGVVGVYLSVFGHHCTDPVFTAMRVQLHGSWWYSTETINTPEYAFVVYPDGTSTSYNTLSNMCLVEAKAPPGAVVLGLIVGGSCLVGFLLIAGVVYWYQRRRGSYQVIN